MEPSNCPTIPQTPEIVRLQERIQALELELSNGLAARTSTQRHFQIFSDTVLDYAFITFDPQGRIVSWSRGAERLLGHSEEEALGQLANIIFTPEDRAKGEVEKELSTALREGRAEDDRWHLRRDGSRFWGSGVLTAHRDREANLQGYSKVMRDLTSRKILEDRLHESGERFRLFSENVRDYALVPVDTAGNVAGWNSGAVRTFGYTEQEIVGRSVSLLFNPEDRQSGVSERDLDRSLSEGRSEDSRWMIRSDGSRFWAHWTTTPMYDSAGNLRGFAKVLRNETERKRSEDFVAESLRAKDLLLREIHHRVKNNLQVITSLLSLQAGQVKDTTIKCLLNELQDRVRAIAALHETLYGSRDLANINFGPYMQQLLNELLSFYAIDPERIQVRTHTDDIVLSIEQALPLGLIVNELVSNALKHAFPKGCGAIDITFRYVLAASENGKEKADTSSCELTVQDDGVGIPKVEDIWRTKSMGLRIVRLFTTQLRGQITVDANSTTRFCIRFPIEEFKLTTPV